MYFKGPTSEEEAGLERVKRGVSKKSIFTRIALQMKIVTVVQIFAHTRSHTLRQTGTESYLLGGTFELTVTVIPSNSDSHTVIRANKERPGLLRRNTCLWALNAAKNRITRNTPHYTYFSFLLTASENVTWHHFHALGVQGQLDQQLLPILDATTADLRQL